MIDADSVCTWISAGIVAAGSGCFALMRLRYKAEILRAQMAYMTLGITMAKIAAQRTLDEIIAADNEGQYLSSSDFEDAYDTMVKDARSAMTRAEKTILS